MSLLNFVSEEVREKIEETKSELLQKKHEAVSSSQNIREAEMKKYKPQHLEKIKFNGADSNFGEKTKVSFFVSKKELELIKIKWSLKEQFDELRIASRDLNKFVEGILNE